MRFLTSAMLASKFRGSMLGALAGDCCGAPYEGEGVCTVGERTILKKYFDKLEGPYFTGNDNVILDFESTLHRNHFSTEKIVHGRHSDDEMRSECTR